MTLGIRRKQFMLLKETGQDLKGFGLFYFTAKYEERGFAVGLEEKYVPLVRLCAVREKVLPYGKETIDQPEKVAKLAQC